MNEKGRQTKLLAAFAILAMVVCAFAVAMPSDNVDAAPLALNEAPVEGDGVKYVSNDTEFGNITDADKSIVIDGEVTISTEKTLNADQTMWIVTGGSVTVNGGTLSIAGTIYNNVGKSDKDSGINVSSGTIAFTGNGKLFSVCAVGPESPSGSITFTGFFTSTDDAVEGYGSYQHYYAANAADLTSYVVENAYTDGFTGEYIYSYGEITISNNVNLPGIGLIVGGVNPLLTSKITVADGYTLSADSITLKGTNTVAGDVKTSAGAPGYVVDTSDTSKINEYQEAGSPVFVNVTEDVDSLDVTVTEAGLTFFVAEGKTVSGTMTLKAAGAEESETDTTIALTGYNGTVTFSYGSAEIVGGELNDGAVVIENATDIIIQKVTVKDTDASLTVPAGATVRIGSDVAIEGKLTINNAGAASATSESPADPVKIRLSGSNTLAINNTADGAAQPVLALGAYVDMNADGAVTGNGKIDLNDNASLTFKAGMVEVTGNGKITNNAVTGGTINLNDGTIIDASSSVIGSSTQEIVVSGEVTVVKNGSIEVNGLLTIEEGAELILEEGAKLIINNLGKVDLLGTISVEATAENGAYIFVYNGSAMTVAGTLDLEGAMSAALNGIMTVTGTINVGDGASANFAAGSTIAAAGNLNVEGTVEGEVANAGTITIDSEYQQTAEFTVYIMDGGVVDLDNVVGTITIDDSQMEYKKNGVDTPISKPTEIQLNNVAGVTVSDSLVIKNEPISEGSTETERVGYGNMVISGAAALATNENDDLTGTAGVTVVSGTLNVAEGATLDINEDAVLTIYKDAELAVAGTLTNTDKDAQPIANSGVINVPGLIQTTEKITSGTINAAMYEDDTVDPEVFNYTTLAKAIAAGATDITVLGEITVEEDVIIPVGTTVTSTGAVVNIDEDATLTVAADANSSAKFKNGDVNVDGTMVVQNLRKSGVNADAVYSDVATTDGVSATYTNIYKAVAAAQDGETVTVTREDGKVVLDKNLTIPAGVTVEIPDAKEIYVEAGVTVTVDGTLSFEDGTYTMQEKVGTKDAAKTIVNGLLEASKTSQYRTQSDDVNQIVGAYFTVDNLECIAPLSYVATVIDDIESNVDIVGPVTAQDVEFEYTADEGYAIVVKGGSSLTAGTITLSGIDMKIEPSSRVNATVAVADGSFVLKDVTAATSATVTISDETSFDENNNEIHTATLAGTLADAKDADDSTKFLDGKVTANGTVAIGAANFGAAVATGVDFEVAEGATATVGATANFYGKTVVNGTMTFDADGITFNGVLVVYGTVSATEDGSATANNELRVGFDKDADNGNIVINIGSGTVSGVTLDTTEGVAIVTPESAFTPVQTQTESIVSTEYYIEDALWMTAYAASGNVDIPDLKAQIDNAEFIAWENADGDAIVERGTYKNIGSTGFEKVYADIKYDIYNVFVTADEGIGTVYIDGKVMTKISNTFVLMDGIELVQFEAGEHEISYVLKNNFSGIVKMYVNGTEDSDMTFTLEGNLESNKTTVDYTINLVGVEPTSPVTPSGDSGSDDGMGLTDYLLIVLVVLIVIMAIMVAMRLMRS